ncbi:hypothetical protein AB0L00_13225 [Actinoallomurus sp. NPDC052308]|uniref:hypothetical protein n=1 Tax=Actinoallomurus sp. NPDC052308 TaxID=3155530 RepID=UPI00342007DE
MQTAVDSDFSPLPQIIERFGLPNPLAVLPELKNRLETVDVSSGHLTRLRDHLTRLADDIEDSAGSLRWQGDAASRFHRRNAETVTSLRRTAAAAQDTVQCQSYAKITMWDLAVWITLAIAILTLIVAAILAIMVATALQSGGTSIVVGITAMSTHTATVTAEILGAIGTVSWLLSSVFGEVRGKLDSPDIVCPVPAPPPGSAPAPTPPGSPTGTPADPSPRRRAV